MKITVLHRKKNLKLIYKEMMIANEVWVVGRITPQMREAIKFAKLINKPVYYNPLKKKTEERFFGK